MRAIKLAGLLADIYPALSTIDMALFGDSRTAACGEVMGTALPDRVPAYSYATWLMAALGWRVNLTGVYGVNTDTIEGLRTRLTAAGIAKDVSAATPTAATVPPSRGFATNGTYSVGLAPKIAVVLIGVNNTNEAIATAGPKYQLLIDDLDVAGYTIVLCNEIPSNRNDNAMQPQLDRRAWLDAATLTSGRKMLKVNTWDALKHPTNPNMCKDGTYGAHTNGSYDATLHPNTYGYRLLGEAIGAAMLPMVRKLQSAARNIAPLTSTSILQFCQMTGTGGTLNAGSNLNGSGGTCVTGSVPTGWTLDRGSTMNTMLDGATQDGTNGNFTLTLSQYTDPDGYAHLVLTGAGRIGPVGTTNVVYLLTLYRTLTKNASSMGNIENGIGVSDGDSIYAAARIKLPAGSVGFVGAGVQVQFSNPSFSTYATGGVGTKILGLPDSTVGGPPDGVFDLMADVDAVFMSPARKLPAGYTAVNTNTIAATIRIGIQSGVDTTFALDISHPGMVKNI